MKIGFVLDDRLDKSDGVQQYVKLVGAWLTKNGHEVHYLVGDSPGATERHVHHMSKTVNARFNKNRMAIPLPVAKSIVKSVIASEKFDVLHVQVPYSPLLAKRIIDAADTSTAIVGTFHILPHGWLSSIGTKALGQFLRTTNKRFDGFMSVSSAAQVFAKTHFGINSVIISNAVDLRRYSNGVKLAHYKDRKNILFLGRFVARKGAWYLLKAYEEILRNDPTFASWTRLIMCSDGPERKKLEALASEIRNKYSAEILFTGFLKENEKADYLASSDIAVFPSTGGESFGIVLIEAMAAGAGVILAGNNPGYSSVLHSMPKTLFNPKNTTQFAELLQNMLLTDNRVLHAEQSELVKQFDIQSVGPEILSFYNEAIAERAKKRNN